MHHCNKKNLFERKGVWGIHSSRQYLVALGVQKYPKSAEDDLGQLDVWMQCGCACGVDGLEGTACALFSLGIVAISEIVHLLPVYPSAPSQLEIDEYRT